jgi:hypothetical protein
MRRPRFTLLPIAAGRRLPRAVETRGVRERCTRLVVELGNRAESWRSAAHDAELAFRHWQSAPAAQRGAAAVSYLAAIDREEKAASEYSLASEACCIPLPQLRASASRPRAHRRRWRLTYSRPEW